LALLVLLEDVRPLSDFIAETMSILETRPDAGEILVERVRPQRLAECSGNYDELYKEGTRCGRGLDHLIGQAYRSPPLFPWRRPMTGTSPAVSLSATDAVTSGRRSRRPVTQTALTPTGPRSRGPATTILLALARPHSLAHKIRAQQITGSAGRQAQDREQSEIGPKHRDSQRTRHPRTASPPWPRHRRPASRA
jgi:hypothetical protein